MKKALLSLGLIAAMLGTTVAPALAGHPHNHNHGGYNRGHHNGHNHGHQHNNGFRGFPIPIPIPVPVPVPNPYPYPAPQYRAPIRVWVTEIEYRAYPYPHYARWQRLVTARWDNYRGGYWYVNVQGEYVRVR